MHRSSNVFSLFTSRQTLFRIELSVNWGFFITSHSNTQFALKSDEFHERVFRFEAFGLPIA